MKAKEIILLIVIIVVGILFHQLYTGEIEIYFDEDDDFIIFSNEYDFEDIQEFEPPFPSLIQVRNSHGAVKILGTDEEKISVSLRKKVWRRKEEDAKKIADELKMIIQKEAEQWTISTNRDEVERTKFRTSFVISVPSSMDIEVRNSYGTVDVSYVRNAEINNRHGEVILADISGEVTLENSYQNVEVDTVESDLFLDSHNSHVYVGSIKGKVHIVHRYGKIELEDISQDVTIEGSNSEVYGENLAGPLKLDSSYRKIVLYNIGPAQISGHSCAIEVDKIEGNLDIENSHGKIWIGNLQGDLVIDGKNLKVEGKTIIGEKIDIKSSYRDIELSEFSGRTTITHSHGKVVLAPYPLTHPLEVKGEYAAIELSWPLGKKYPLEIRVKNGEINWELAEKISIIEEDHTRTLKAFIQETDVPSISLTTSYRTIWVTQ